MVERWSDQPEVAEGDLSEQSRELLDDAADLGDVGDDDGGTVPDEVDPADAQEQHQSVGYGEDDYR
ncbi:hypothetical protein E1212_12455 [Jiangella ureilytica]|uniref:DUF5709 domain-containing protein n=1 Tax=Jiangella ureilytica TaxID=2530374 RepID=A0A4R4RNK2_9ACTN|nr:hypothetical protein [Jiangella ureilytica]TDC51398.1 hypothetical protein E1212_12455 [Jiangella ureilytica]